MTVCIPKAGMRPSSAFEVPSSETTIGAGDAIAPEVITDRLCMATDILPARRDRLVLNHIAVSPVTGRTHDLRHQNLTYAVRSQKALFESTRMVTGPSFTSSTCIIS